MVSSYFPFEKPAGSAPRHALRQPNSRSSGHRARPYGPAEELLLLDEPSLGLTPLIVRQIFSVIRDLNGKRGLTVFLVEQTAYYRAKAGPSWLCHGERKNYLSGNPAVF